MCVLINIRLVPIYLCFHIVTVSVGVSEDPGHEPDHKAGIQFHTLESRMDYMGSSVLMGRISNVSMKLSDEWKLDCIKRGHQQPGYQRLTRSKR